MRSIGAVVVSTEFGGHRAGAFLQATAKPNKKENDPTRSQSFVRETPDERLFVLQYVLVLNRWEWL